MVEMDRLLADFALVEIEVADNRLVELNSAMVDRFDS